MKAFLAFVPENLNEETKQLLRDYFGSFKEGATLKDGTGRVLLEVDHEVFPVAGIWTVGFSRDMRRDWKMRITAFQLTIDADPSVRNLIGLPGDRKREEPKDTEE